MEILLRGIRKGNEEKVERGLKDAFADAPAVIIEDGPGTGGTVYATVIYPPGDTRDRNSVAAIIDTVLMRNDYVFCNVDHREERSVSVPEVECPGGWPAL